MLETTKKLVEEMKELERQVMKTAIGEVDPDDIFDCGNIEELTLILKAFKLMHTSMDLVLEQARVMDEMNEKLDKLLEK